jgi:DNA-binding transcriptional ArsR family regulator
MRLELRMKYCEKVYRRYHNASKESKAKILDELCKVCEYNRKYAIWKLNRLRDQEKTTVPSKRSRSRKYGNEVLGIVEEVWKKSGYPWSVRLKEIIRLWFPWIKKHYPITAEVEEKLLGISPSTIDRHLKPLKDKLRRRIYGRTKPGTLLRHKIPVKTSNWDVERPGYMEADLVSHSGESSYGEFIYSLNFTDIFSQWVETQSVMGKGQEGILEAFDQISQRLPFKIAGIDSDNGSEFINHHIWNYCEERNIQFTRSRPYKKDDNAHIEQKNWTHVRKLIGWDRYDSPQALAAMNDLYENELPLYNR